MPIAFQLAAEDSTGQKITLIVIGLLLAALALAFLTVWYYRVTDPGPSHRKSSRSGPSGPAGPGPGSTRGTSSSSWKDRLSNFSLPTIPVRSAKPAGQAPRPQTPGTGSAVKPKTKTENPPPPRAGAPALGRDAAKPAPKQPTVTESAPETVSLEGGFYLDLTEVSDSSQPPTNVGSMNALDLRQPAPLLDPDRAPVPDSVSLPVSASPSAPTAKDDTVSFDDWLAEVEATDGQ